jgi:hypothetical protein
MHSQQLEERVFGNLESKPMLMFQEEEVVVVEVELRLLVEV